METTTTRSGRVAAWSVAARKRKRKRCASRLRMRGRDYMRKNGERTWLVRDYDIKGRGPPLRWPSQFPKNSDQKLRRSPRRPCHRERISEVENWFPGVSALSNASL